MNLEEFQTLKFRCIKCGSTSIQMKIKPEGSAHYAEARCDQCDKWVDWIKRPAIEMANTVVTESMTLEQQKVDFWQKKAGHFEGYRDKTTKVDKTWGPSPTLDAKPPFTPKQLAHPRTLEERIASLEQVVGILSQILIGKRI